MSFVYQDEIRALTDRLVKAWEQADVSGVGEMILPDAAVDFDIFEKGLNKETLLQKLSERPRRIAFARFEQLNNIVVTGRDMAKQSVAIIGTYADPNNGTWTRFNFGGTFALELRRTANGWKYSSIKFMLTDESVVQWPRLTSAGIAQNKGPGDPSFVANWIKPNHEDRIGWFADKRLPVINPVYDSPWYGISDRVRPEHEEELVEEAFFRYAFGIDFNNFKLWDDAFTDDCQCIYGDTQPYGRRGVIEFLKPEKQGSPRCVHTGFFTDVTIKGDSATAQLYLRGAQFSPDAPITPDELNKRYTWARYKLVCKNVNGVWKIHQLNFYQGMAVK